MFGVKDAPRFFERLGRIAGFIALAFIVSICAQYVENRAEKIPQVLTYGLTTIFDFYFGTKRRAPTLPAPLDNEPALRGSIS
jgi:hypothetical protein